MHLPVCTFAKQELSTQRHASSGASEDLVVGSVSPNFGRVTQGCPGSSCGSFLKLSASGRREFRNYNQQTATMPTLIPQSRSELTLWLLSAASLQRNCMDILGKSNTRRFQSNPWSESEKLASTLHFPSVRTKIPPRKRARDVISFCAALALSSTEPECEHALGGHW